MIFAAWARGTERRRISESLAELGEGQGSADLKALAGRAPWLRLRVGDHRILLRPLVADDDAGEGFLIARIVHRGELERAVGRL